MAQSVIDGAIGEVLTGPGCQQFDDPVLTGRQIEVRAVPEATRVLEDELAAGQSFFIRGRPIEARQSIAPMVYSRAPNRNMTTF